MKTLAPNQPSQSALDFFNASQETISYLSDRWNDEKEYEDINEYKIPLEPIAKKHGVIIDKMNKRPFGCNFSVDGRTYQLKCSGTKYAYQRIK